MLAKLVTFADKLHFSLLHCKVSRPFDTMHRKIWTMSVFVLFITNANIQEKTQKVIVFLMKLTSKQTDKTNERTCHGVVSLSVSEAIMVFRILNGFVFSQTRVSKFGTLWPIIRHHFQFQCIHPPTAITSEFHLIS